MCAKQIARSPKGPGDFVYFGCSARDAKKLTKGLSPCQLWTVDASPAALKPAKVTVPFAGLGGGCFACLEDMVERFLVKHGHAELLRLR